MSKNSVQELFVKLVRNLSEAEAFVKDPDKYLESQNVVLTQEQKAALISAMKDIPMRVTGPGGHHRDYDIHMNTELLDEHEDYTQHLDATG